VIDAGQTLFDEVESLATGLAVGPNDVIDVHLIGHSRGAVVVSEVAQDLASNQGIVPQMDHGYLKVTLLDPHPANLKYGVNADTSSPVIALPIYDNFEFDVHDPDVIIPPRVNEVDVLYEDTPANETPGVIEPLIINLHGLSPADITVQDLSQTLVLADNLTGPGIGHSEVHDWYETNLVDNHDLGSSTVPSVLAPPSSSLPSVILSSEQISTLTDQTLQALIAANPAPSIPVTAADLDTVVFAIDGLHAPSVPAFITLNLAAGSFSDIDLYPPDGVTIILVGTGAPTIVGNSPALTVSSGTVIVTGVTFTTATDAPTILVTGGNLILRDDTIEESTGGDDAAIDITGGALDLGTTDSPGNNILNVNGAGEFVHNTTPNQVPGSGDTFSSNGTPLAASSLSFTALSSSLTSSVFGQSVTFTATVTPDSTDAAAPTGSVDFFDTTTNTDLGSVQLAGGSASLASSGLNAGGHLIRAIYSGDGNFTLSLDSLTQTVAPATPSVSALAQSATYTGSPQGYPTSAVTASGPNGLTSSGGTLSVTYNGSSAVPTTAGTYSVLVTFLPNDTTDYTSGSTKTAWTITPATPVITWANPSAIAFFTALSGSQLDATASVSGTFVYTPPAGTLLSAGTDTLSVTFTPADGADYTTATATVQVAVLGPGVTVIGTHLYFAGGNTSNDQVQVNAAGSSNTGSTGVKLNASLNGVNIQTTYSQSFTTIDVFLQGGNDNIQLASSLTINAVVTAGNGNNNVHLGNGNNTVTLGNGNDNIQAGNGSNMVTAGGGNDNVTLGNGNNVLTLGNGNDNATLGNGSNTVVSGNGNDNILTGNGNNLIAAGLGYHTVQAGNGSNILIDGSVQLTESGDSLRQVLDDWTQYGALTDDVANILARLKVTYNMRYANTLDASAGLDWFWEIYGQDRTNRKVTDLLN
jgi:hypothetical protein